MAPGGYTWLAVIFSIITALSVCFLFAALTVANERSSDDMFKWAFKVIGPCILVSFAVTLAAIVMRYRQPDVYAEDGKKDIQQEMVDNAVKKYFDSMPVEEKYKILTNGSKN